MSLSDTPPAGPFAVREPVFTHGNVTLRILLPRSADELIDEGAFNRDERLPYWADLWPGARALARWLLDKHPSPVAGAPPLRIAELGCGASALACQVLAMRGFDVLATDYEDEALELVHINARRNELAASTASPASLKWGQVRTRMIDWREPPLDFGRGQSHGPTAGFDLLLGADLMYEERNATALADLVPTILADGGRFLLADPGRRYLPDFVSRMSEQGFAIREIAIIDEPHHADPTRPSSRVQIIEFTRRERLPA